MNHQDILIIDQTIREGMQYRGLMFSIDERMQILEFQENLGVDVSQAGYPPAHKSEAESVKQLFFQSKKNEYKIRVSGLCRALVDDVKEMVSSGFIDFQLHSVLTKEMLARRSVDSIFKSLDDTIGFIRSKRKDACIEVSLLDIGRTEADLLEKCARFLIDDLKVNILVLPDTSGIMAPNLFYDKVRWIVQMAEGKNTRIGVHCHNDMGMGTANTILGIKAGASVVQATALGIGERNGIGDLFIVGKCLKDQGYRLNLNVDAIDLFRAYYSYIDKLCMSKTGADLINYRTPVFGRSMKTHVAGTHGIGKYGIESEAQYYLNVLCGKQLVKKYLDQNGLIYDKVKIGEIVSKIKARSVTLGCCVPKNEVVDIVNEVNCIPGK